MLTVFVPVQFRRSANDVSTIVMRGYLIERLGVLTLEQSQVSRSAFEYSVFMWSHGRETLSVLPIT